MTLAFTDDSDVDVTTCSWWESAVLLLLPSFSIDDYGCRYHFKSFNGKLFLIKEEQLVCPHEG